MIKLLSFGDHLEKGIYKVHSRFSEVVNFCSVSSFIFIVGKSIGSGHFNIVVEGVSFAELEKLVIAEDYFLLNDEKVFFETSKRYDSQINIINFDEKKFWQNLDHFEKALIENSSGKSLTFLLDESRKKNFKSSYEIEFVRRFDSALECFTSSNYLEGVKLIKGVGFGLTPSGDDFIAGFLIALNVIQKLERVDYSNLIVHIYEAAKGNNAFTNAFLLASKNGSLFEKFKNLIHSILFSGQNEILENTRTLISFGETSGADQSVGFLFGIKRNFNDGNRNSEKGRIF
ncbi:MAG: DUF2877 domain-containing protein [Ignavibacteriaceae bacterium]|nr:DUF2877 domain-containing protein [Ignavibacteriaceae bacterium]